MNGLLLNSKGKEEGRRRENGGKGKESITMIARSLAWLIIVLLGLEALVDLWVVASS